MLSNKDINFNDETQLLIINGEKHPIGEAIAAKIGDLTETGLSGDTVAAQLGSVNTLIGNISSDLTIRDISDHATIDSAIVQEYHAYLYGKIIYIAITLKAGITDQTTVVSAIPYTIKGNYGVLPMFNMNAADSASNGVCAYVGNNIQYRGSTTTGSGGTKYSGMFLVDAVTI